MNTYIYAGNSSLLVVKDNDLNSISSIRNHYLKETIEQTKALIYG